MNKEWKWKEKFEDYDDLDLECFLRANEAAEADGFEVIMREPNQLLLDLDGGTEVVLPEVMEKLENKFGIVKVEQWTSKSGNYHMSITCATEFSPEEAVALQAILGSDPIRELLGLVRIRNGVPEPTRLFKPKVGG